MNAKLAFISAHSSSYTIRRLCAVLRVARSWFYGWRAGAAVRAAGQRAEAALVEQIRSLFQDRGARYGAPRAFMPTCEPEAFTAAASGWPGS